MTDSPRSCVVFAALGPNPAPLTELLWALTRQRGWVATEAFVVVDARGDHYLRRELLRKGGPFQELQQLLGPALLGGKEPRSRVATGDDGLPIQNDDDEAQALAYNAAVWKTAREALAAAGEKPVVFALAAGRRRTMTALVTTAFQMLARPRDECLDVRVSDRRAEGATGFYFPEQKQRSLRTHEGTFEANEVQVELVEVKLPRLRELIPEERLASYGDALLAAQSAIDEARPPRLMIDLPQGKALVDGKPLPLSQPQLFWYAALAWARKQPGEGWIPADGSTVVEVLDAGQAVGWFDWKTSGFFQDIGRHLLLKPAREWPQKSLEQTWRSMRSSTGSDVGKFCSIHGIRHEARLVPEKRRVKVNGKVQHQQRLLLAPERIELRGLVTLSCIFKPGFVARLEVSPNTEHLPMTTIRTSLSHPILVDWLSGIAEGRVGLTFAPGKHSTSVYVPGTLWRRDLAMDLDELVSQGVTDLVCLLQDRDLTKLKIPHLVAEATARGLRVHRMPIADQGVPGSRKALVDLLARVQQRLTEGASVVIHCEGGKGRTGVVAGCLLVSLGASAPEALRRLQEARGPSCPENSRQRAFIKTFAAEARPWGERLVFGSRTSGALTIFFLQGTDSLVPPLITLSEALERGVAGVREATGYQHVTLDNLGDLPVLCLAGDLVKGGMQDRVLRHDTLLAPRQTGLVVDACCVEQGRWGGRKGDSTDRFRVALEMAPAQLRRHLVNGASQGEVWQEVAQTQERLGRSRGRALRDARSETSLGLSLESPEIQEESWNLLAPFVDGLEQDSVQGYLAYIEGVGWQMEWFATRALWEASAVRLLRALAVEALGAAGGGRPPGLPEARRWLASAALLNGGPQQQAGAAVRQPREGDGRTLTLTVWEGQVLHGVAVGS